MVKRQAVQIFKVLTVLFVSVLTILYFSCECILSFPVNNKYGSRNAKTRAYADSENSNQPAHPRSLI